MKVILKIVLIVTLIVCAVPNPYASADSNYEYEVTPYLWLPSIEGELKYSVPGGSSSIPGVTVGPSDYLEHLEMAGMITAGIRRDRWSLFTDLIYLDFELDTSSVNSVDFTGPSGRVPLGAASDTGTSSSLEGVEWTLAGGYRLYEKERATSEIFGGFRYFDLEFSTDWRLSASVISPVGGLALARTGRISQQLELWDIIVGARGKYSFSNESWYLPYYFDIGAGDSDLTWQGVLGIAYVFEPVDIKLVYRHLEYEADGELIDTMRFSGPALGFTFKF